MVPWAMGQPLRFAEGEGPVLAPVRDAAAIGALRVAGVAERAAPIMETVRLVRAALDADAPRTALIGFAGCPFTVACYMVEGHGSRDFAAARGMAYADPALFGRLIRMLVEATADYLLAQAEAGAEALMLFDSWAGLLPPAQFRRWVIEPNAALVAPSAQAPAGDPADRLPAPGRADAGRVRAADGRAGRRHGHRHGPALGRRRGAGRPWRCRATSTRWR